MSAVPDEVVIAAIALVASLSLAIPVRLVGLRETVSALGAMLAALNRRKFTLLLLGVIGALAGLWRFDQVRALFFGWFF